MLMMITSHQITPLMKKLRILIKKMRLKRKLRLSKRQKIRLKKILLKISAKAYQKLANLR